MNDDFKKLDKKIDTLDKKFNKRFDELMTVLNGFASDVDNRFNKVEARLDSHDVRFDGLEGSLFKIEKKLEAHDAEFRKQNAKYDHLVNTIDSFIARIDTYETELAARDNKIERLERWVQEIAKKTGVSMPL